MNAPPVIDCRRCRINIPAEELAVKVWRGMPIKLASGRCLHCKHTTTAVLFGDEAEDVRLLDLTLAGRSSLRWGSGAAWKRATQQRQPASDPDRLPLGKPQTNA